MKTTRLGQIYFSATGTTSRCVEHLASAVGVPAILPINLADRERPVDVPQFGEDDAVIFGMLVYGGRVPALAAKKLKQFRGNGAKAVAMVVYGNRDYDDALLELTDALMAQGFVVVAAAAFVGQHSIFPKVGTSRPDTADMQKLEEFGRHCREVLEAELLPALGAKGKRPYKKPGGVPVHPQGDQGLCKKCGRCVELCPTMAIQATSPWATDTETCISCGRCIHVCPHSARKYSGLTYSVVGALFKAFFSRRREPEVY